MEGTSLIACMVAHSQMNYDINDVSKIMISHLCHNSLCVEATHLCLGIYSNYATATAVTQTSKTDHSVINVAMHNSVLLQTL